ncbi:ferritin-like metal-binding protein YciE [Bradyrhizobium algeriense]|uniref:Ferritin-like metal-binding protein YciE n=1 Tax=Bradyrhizobium algeriense TaxID=634784 RepID=A0ABU8B593_9BRAD
MPSMGIIKEADEMAGEIEDKAALDTAIVADAQAAERCEMCRYGARAENSVTTRSCASSRPT